MTNLVQNTAPVWQRLNDYLAKMTNDQISYINFNETCVTKKQEMNKVFIEWLFEKYKNDFVQVSSFNDIANDYVDTIITGAEEFVKNQANLAKDNENMRKELEELRKFKEEYQKNKEVLV